MRAIDILVQYLGAKNKFLILTPKYKKAETTALRISDFLEIR